jgi:hypothetical protein
MQSEGTMRLAPDGEIDDHNEITFTFAHCVCALFSERKFWLNLPGEAKTGSRQHVSLTVLEDEKPVLVTVLSSIALKMLAGELGIGIDIPAFSEKNVLRIRVHNTVKGHHFGIVTVGEQKQPTSRPIVMEQTLQFRHKYIITFSHPVGLLHLFHNGAATLHQLHYQPIEFKSDRYAFVSASQARYVSGGGVRFSVPHRQFLISIEGASPMNPVNEFTLAGMAQHRFSDSDVGGFGVSTILLGATPVDTYHSTKQELALGRKEAAWFSLPRSLSDLDITHLASAASVDYPSFHPIVRQLAEGDTLVIMKKNADVI